MIDYTVKATHTTVSEVEISSAELERLILDNEFDFHTMHRGLSNNLLRRFDLPVRAFLDGNTWRTGFDWNEKLREATPQEIVTWDALEVLRQCHFTLKIESGII